MQYFTTNDGDFRLDSLFGASRNIPPNSSRDIQVCFKPLARGDRIGGIRMLTNIPQTFEPLDGVDDGNYDGGPEQYIRRDTAYAELGMSGIGKAVGKMTSVALTAKPFIDSSLIGVELCRIVDLTNFGTQSILINDMQFVGAAKGDYTYSGITLPYTLDAQKSVNIQIVLLHRPADLVLCSSPFWHSVMIALFHTPIPSTSKDCKHALAVRKILCSHRQNSTRIPQKMRPSR
jgi:hypothetical protein